MPCRFESDHKSASKAGPVKDNELLCRAASDMHFKPNGKVRNSLLKKGELFRGELSVWRLAEVGDLSAMHALLSSQSSSPVRHVLDVQAGDLRSIRLQSGAGQGVCAVDDTRTGDHTHHDAHAALATCQHAGFLNDEDPAFLFVFDRVLQLYKKRLPEGDA